MLNNNPWNKAKENSIFQGMGYYLLLNNQSTFAYFHPGDELLPLKPVLTLKLVPLSMIMQKKKKKDTR